MVDIFQQKGRAGHSFFVESQASHKFKLHTENGEPSQFIPGIIY